MKDIPIGEFFTIGKDTYKVVRKLSNDNEGCGNCDMTDDTGLCNKFRCFHELRDDNISVEFILYDSEEDTNA